MPDRQARAAPSSMTVSDRRLRRAASGGVRGRGARARPRGLRKAMRRGPAHVPNRRPAQRHPSCASDTAPVIAGHRSMARAQVGRRPPAIARPARPASAPPLPRPRPAPSPPRIPSHAGIASRHPVRRRTPFAPRSSLRLAASAFCSARCTGKGGPKPPSSASRRGSSAPGDERAGLRRRGGGDGEPKPSARPGRFAMSRRRRDRGPGLAVGRGARGRRPARRRPARGLAAPRGWPP